jgi:hypothetical protein
LSKAAGADDFCKGVGHNATVDAKPVPLKPTVVYVEPYSMDAVKQAVATKGPLSIGIDASCISFRFYSDGVLSTDECSTKLDDIDHAVILVGYGQEEGMLLLSLAQKSI